MKLKSGWDEWRDYEISRPKIVYEVLELCCFEWFQNRYCGQILWSCVLELCCFEWFQNKKTTSKVSDYVLELCCFEWFQNLIRGRASPLTRFRAVLFRMVPKPPEHPELMRSCFRAVLFRMVPKPLTKLS